MKRLAPGKIAGTFTGNDLTKDLTSEQIVLVQIDPVSGKAYLVDAVKNSDNTITAEFPCTGPFVIAQVK